MYLYYLQTPVNLAEREQILARVKIGMARTALELVVLETCSRYEIYSASPPDAHLRATLQQFGGNASWGQMQGRAALRHLFRVASGLESPLFGEKAIQGQVKQAYLGALSKVCHFPKELHRSFQAALHTGKRVRRETSLDSGAMSHASATWEILQGIIGQSGSQQGFAAVRVCFIGVGELNGKLTGLLRSKGIEKFLLGNRSYDKALEASQRWGGRAFHLERTAEVLRQCQVLVCATRAPHYIVRPQHILPQQQPLYVFDLAVPRDVDPQVLASPTRRIRLWNVQDVEQQIVGNSEQRRHKAPLAEQIIERELDSYYEHTPVIYEHSPVHA